MEYKKTIVIRSKRFGDAQMVEIDIYSVAKAMSAEQLGFLLETFLNTFNSAQRSGERVATVIMESHPTLQNMFVNLALGALNAMAKVQYTDARNDQAIQNCREIAIMIGDEKIKYGMFI